MIDSFRLEITEPAEFSSTTFSVLLAPVIGATVMANSSVSVITNALHLRRVRLDESA